MYMASVWELSMPVQCRIRHKLYLDLVISKGIDLLLIYETGLITRETSAHLAEMTHQAFSFYQESRAQREEGGSGPILVISS